MVSPPIINIRESCELLPALEEGQKRRIPPSAVNTSKIYAKVQGVSQYLSFDILFFTQG